MRVLLISLAVCLSGAQRLPSASLELLPEFLRPDPFGGIVAPDRGSARAQAPLIAARGGYVSFHLVVKLPDGGPYSLDLKLTGRNLQVDVFREWFHLTRKRYFPDALIPVNLPYRSQLPEPDNQVDKQTAQAFWVDVWAPPGAAPGVVEGTATLEAAGRTQSLPLRIEILAAAVPGDDPFVIDHNSYGSSWIAEYYRNPGESDAAFFQSDRFFKLIHAHHRLFYEHRGVFHQLGYGHGGKVGPEFAPELTGSGKNKRIAGWDLYDRHYGPLLDGSAFEGSRRGRKPVPFVYLPVNPEWPASYLWWGEPGYETEFVNVVSEMERHFREKGWTQTRFELFFNHKKRYKAFEWDGDEVRFLKDNRYFLEFGRLLKKAVPSDSPVRFVFRSDSSWAMEAQFRELAGVVNFWVCGGGEFSWFDYAPKMLKDRGDIVWFYSGPPNVAEPSVAITKFPLRVWMWGIDGYIHWLTVSPGADPWFRFDGGGTALVYPGVRFGIPGPIPSVRLKLQRNAVQDLALLDSFRAGKGIDALRTEAAKRYNGSAPKDWWTPRPKLADTPAHEWSNTDIAEATDLDQRLFKKLDPSAWQNVRDYVIALAKEAR
ncbi:MAG: DUF4091 domain-containing protein [Bryobacteraceae bacterium]|nr:DUF4091 domain-containing protein [Bryobacteraceae bacterium]